MPFLPCPSVEHNILCKPREYLPAQVPQTKKADEYSLWILTGLGMRVAQSCQNRGASGMPRRRTIGTLGTLQFNTQATKKDRWLSGN